jgi:hypothetical protein
MEQRDEYPLQPFIQILGFCVVAGIGAMLFATFPEFFAIIGGGAVIFFLLHIASKKD